MAKNTNETELLEFVIALSTTRLKEGYAQGLQQTREFDKAVKSVLGGTKAEITGIGAAAESAAAKIKTASSTISSGLKTASTAARSDAAKTISTFNQLGNAIETKLSAGIKKIEEMNTASGKLGTILTSSVGAANQALSNGLSHLSAYNSGIKSIGTSAINATVAINGLANAQKSSAFSAAAQNMSLQASQTMSFGSSANPQATIGAGTSGQGYVAYGRTRIGQSQVGLSSYGMYSPGSPLSQMATPQAQMGFSSYSNYSSQPSSGYGMFSPPSTRASAPAAPGGLNPFAAWHTSASEMKDKMVELQTQIDKVGQRYQSMQSLGVQALTVIGLTAGSAVKAFMDYEAQINKFKAVSQAAKAEVMAFEKATQDLGKSTQFSASAVAKAGVELAKLGFSAGEAIRVLPGIVSAAAASQIELADAAVIVSTALKGFQLQASDSLHIADLFSVAAAKSAIDFQDLGETFKYVSGVASASNQSIEDMTALIAIMGNNMIKGSQAGTSLRMAMTRLQRPTAQTRDILDTLNIEIGDKMTGKMRRLPDIIKDLQNAMSGLDSTTKNAAIATIFGQEALSGMMAIFNQSPEEIDKMIAAMNDVDGAADRMAKTSFQGLSAEFKIMLSTMETAAISFGPAMSETLIPLIKSVKDLFNGFAEMPEPMKQTIVEAVALAAQVGLMATIFGASRMAISTMASTLVTLIGVEKLAAAATYARNIAAAAGAAAQTAYTNAIASGATRTTASIVGIQGMAAAINGTLIPSIGSAVIAMGPWIAALVAMGLAVNAVKNEVDGFMQMQREEERADAEYNATLEKRGEAIKAFGAYRDKLRKEGKSASELFMSGKLSPEEVLKAAAGAQIQGNDFSRPDLVSLAAELRSFAAKAREAKRLTDKMTKQQEEWNELRHRAIGAETEIDKTNLFAKAAEVKKQLLSTMEQARGNDLVRIKDLQDTAQRQAELEKKMREDTRRGGRGGDPVLKQLNQELRILENQHKARLDNLEVERQRYEIQKQYLKSEEARKDLPTRAVLYAKEMFPQTTDFDKLMKQFSEFNQGSQGFTRHQMKAFELGLSPMQYMKYLNDASETNPKASNYEQMANEMKMSLADFGKYMSGIGYKKENMTNYQMLGEIFKMTTKELDKFFNETITPNTAGRSPDEMWANITDLLFDNDQNIMQNIDFMNSEFANEMRRNALPSTKAPDFGNANFMGAKVKEYENEIERLKGLRSKFLAGGYQEQVSDIDQKISEMKTQIVKSQLEFDKAWNETIDKDTKSLTEALAKREEMLNQNGEKMRDAAKSIVEAFKNDVASSDRSFNEQTMNEYEKFQSNVAAKQADTRKKLEEFKSLVLATPLNESDQQIMAKAISDLEELVKRADDIDTKATERAKRLFDLKKNLEFLETQGDRAAKVTQKSMSEYQNPVVQINPETGDTLGAIRGDRRALIDALNEELNIMQQQLAEYSNLTKEEQKSEEIKKQRGALQEEYLKALVIEAGWHSEILDQLDKEIYKETQLYEQAMKLSNELKGVGDMWNSVGSLVSSIAGGNQSGQQLGSLISGVGSLMNTYSSGVKEMQDASNEVEASGAQWKTILALAAQVFGMFHTLFPDGNQIKQEAQQFQNDYISAMSTATRFVADQQLKSGKITIDEYYKKINELNKQSRDNEFKNLQTEWKNKAQSFMSVLDHALVVTTGSVSAPTQKRFEDLDRWFLAKTVELEAKYAGIQNETTKAQEQAAIEKARRLSQIESETRLIQAQTTGDTLAQIEAETSNRISEIAASRAEYLRQLNAGEIMQDEFDALMAQAQAQEDQANAESEKKRQSYYSTLTQLATENVMRDIQLNKSGLDAKLELIDWETRQTLSADKERMAELEKGGLEWTAEYQLLKNKEVGINAEGEKKKLLASMEYYAQIKELHISYSEALAALTSSEIDDLAAQRDKRLLDIDRWKNDMLQQFPEQAALIIDIFSKQSAGAQKEFDMASLDSAQKLAASRRELAQLQAQATVDTLDDVQTEYANALGEIDDEEEKALKQFEDNEAMKTQATQKAIAKRLIAQKNYYDSLKSMALDQLNQAKEIRDMIFKMDTQTRQEQIDKYNRDLSELDLLIRERELAIARIKEGFDSQRAAVKNQDLTAFENAQAAIDMEAKKREALKFYQVNVTDVSTANASTQTQTDAVSEWTKFLEQQAENDRIQKLITGDQYTSELKNANLIRAKYAMDQINTVRSQYGAEILTLQQAGKKEEEIDILRKKRDKEIEDLRSMYSEAFKTYQELEIRAIQEREDAQTAALRTEIDGLNLRKTTIINNIEAEQIKIDELKAKYDQDMLLIDNAIQKVTQSHNNLSISIDSVRNNLSGTLDGIINQYNALYSATEKVRGSIAATAVSGGSGSSSSSSSSSGSFGSNYQDDPYDRIKVVSGQKPPAGYPVNDGNYYYRTSSAMQLALYKGLKKGGIMPNLPGYENQDVMGPYMLAPNEEVVNSSDRSTILDHIMNLPDMFSRAAQSYFQNNDSSSRQVIMYNTVRDNSDIDMIVDKVTESINGKRLSGVSIYGHLSR